MRIGIDIQTTLGQKTGFGFYVGNLIKNLQIVDTTNKYYFFKPKTHNDLSAPKRLMWDQFGVPKLAKDHKIDILHQPSFSAPIFYSGKVVVTVHDLIAIKFGSDIPFFSRQFFSRWMPFSYRKADKIIAISEHTKKDIIKYLHINENKIKVIPLAADEKYQQINDKLRLEKIKSKYRTGANYLLHIGTLNPRKNLGFMIDVFAQIANRYPNYNLVITGKEGWYYENLYQQVRDLGLVNRVIFTGYIEEQDKVDLYNGAAIFVFPSIYEGFGLPPLEAMSCGIPVISSNTSSMPEVIDNAGILLSPTDKNSWIKAIRLIIDDAKIRKNLQAKGLERAKKFSWKKSAQETLKVYEEISRNIN